ncbi:ATP-binding protein [Streptomyces sp. A1136]|uniref:ATP-binding protein n=1 Tax=Streptomyces sp. A1136 TaxID=2563102 RepID=UPI00109EB21F|nr:ATP-binding protein [Streptomyces sp. A1136]THA52504.1 ATP-binding protein [Streptomyces sp. A1136]
MDRIQGQPGADAGRRAVGSTGDGPSGAGSARAVTGPSGAGSAGTRAAGAPTPGTGAVGSSGSGTSAAAAPTAGAPSTGGLARVVTLTAGDFALTVNPVDGSEIEPLRPGTETPRPAKRGPASRTARQVAARPPALPGSTVPSRPLLRREEEQERLERLLGRGRSVRLTGPAGSGRSALLDSVAAACAGRAPDGVVRLSGYGQQQPLELLHALHAAVYESAAERPDRTELLARVRDIGAIVLIDDLELGGAALDELLRATPECAYLLAATPATKAPSDHSHLEEVFLGGLGRAECLQLMETLTGRPLTEEETAWAADVWFASEGLPLRFVQAAALLRGRDELNHRDREDDDEPGVFEGRPREAAHVPLPTPAEGAAPAELLASRVSESARAALRIACALGGEMPHHAHLPALVGDTHADAAVAELLDSGLLTPVGARYRLAHGVARQLEEAGYGDTAAEEARTAARHYAWWTGHASVTPERVAGEADAVLAALAGADVVAAVMLARTAAPALAASLHWEAWERALRSGAEAARKAGEVAEQAYFHHELGVLALCEGRLERARAELEASIGLRGALADKRGTVAGRRALALVTDREAAAAQVSPPLRLEAPALPAAPSTAPVAAPAASVPATSAVPRPLARPVTAPMNAPVSAASTRPPAPGGSEAQTQVVSTVRRPEAPTTPSTLSEVFENAFPTAPKQEPVTAPVPVPGAGAGPGRAWAGEPHSRRRTAFLAAAGALAVAVIGTVVGLAVSDSDTRAPKDPAVSSSPDIEPDTDPGTDSGGSAPAGAPEPGTADPSAAPSDGATPGPGEQAAEPVPGTTRPPGSTSGGATPTHKPAPPAPGTKTPVPTPPVVHPQTPSPTTSSSTTPPTETPTASGTAGSASGSAPSSTQ